MIDSLKDHHIVCGFGRVGSQVTRDLAAARADAVVVDSDGDARDAAEALGIHFIEGDASDEAVLLQAGIARARSIVACSDSDAVNVFITLTARELRTDIPIVARAAAEDTEKKLRRAGADRVISPYKSSGTEMARLALHRQLSGVVDVDDEYRLEEIVVDEGCRGVGPEDRRHPRRVDDRGPAPRGGLPPPAGRGDRASPRRRDPRDGRARGARAARGHTRGRTRPALKARRPPRQ